MKSNYFFFILPARHNRETAKANKPERLHKHHSIRKQNKEPRNRAESLFTQPS